jgi:uncharacterized phiE125 gp8 family phage protein
MLTLSPPPVSADAVDAAKTYLRIEHDEEDATLVSLLAAALAHAEAFLNLLLLRRTGVERLPVSSAWQRLSVTPVKAIVSVTGLPAEGAAFMLPVSAYALDIDGSGDGWVRVTQPGAAGRVDVSVEAGMAASWDAVPEPLRLAVLRLVGHLYAYRDAPGDAGPPAAVAALLRPWRRMRLH